jgi:hypothetical protein
MTSVVGALLGLVFALAIHIGQSQTETRPLRVFRMPLPIAAALAVAMLAISGGTASAHGYPPASSIIARVGPYTLEVLYFGEPVGGRELQLELVPARGSTEPSRYQATAVPGPATNAVPVVARLTSPDHAGVIGSVNLPVSGRWLLNIDVDGPLGPASGEAAITAAPPASAMPDWLAWLIGTLPVSVSLIVIALRVARGIWAAPHHTTVLIP